MVTVQPFTIMRGVALHLRGNLEAATRRIAVFAVYVKTMIYNPIEYAAWTHAEFVHIHPFNDGNGRIARLLLNYQLMFNGYLPIIIPFEERNQYYQALQVYDHDHNLEPFAELIGKYVYEELKKTAKYIRR